MSLFRQSLKFDIYPHLDALIIFHHEWESLESAANSFRFHYPHGKLLIARDTLPIEKRGFLEALGVKYVNSYSTTEFFLNLKNSGRSLESISNQEFLSKIDQDLKRITEALSLSNSEFLLFMEADSLVLGKVGFDSRFAMDTLTANRYSKPFLSFLKQATGKRMPVRGWGFVTGVVRASSLAQSIQWGYQNQEILLKIFNKDKQFIYLDHFLPVLFHLAGEDIYESGQVGECLRDPNWKRKKYTLLHQYRINY
jgi:hypothetical protein